MLIYVVGVVAFAGGVVATVIGLGLWLIASDDFSDRPPSITDYD